MNNLLLVHIEKERDGKNERETNGHTSSNIDVYTHTLICWFQVIICAPSLLCIGDYIFYIYRFAASKQTLALKKAKYKLKCVNVDQQPLTTTHIRPTSVTTTTNSKDRERDGETPEKKEIIIINK